MQLWFIPPNQQTLSIYSIFRPAPMPPIILRPLDAAFGVKEYKSFGGRYAETVIENKGTSSSSYFGHRLAF